MSLGKKDISKNIRSKARISSNLSISLLNTFIRIIQNSSKNKTIKISGFGTFLTKKSPARIGRNPKTKEEFLISERSKLTFKSSNQVKSIIN